MELPVATFNYKRIISFVLIFTMAVVTGLSVGRIYVDNLEVPTTVSANEEDLREKKSDIEAWVSQSVGKNPMQGFTPVQLYNIAEYKLYKADKYYKLMTGVVNAPMGIKQQMKSEKLFRDGQLIFNKLSPSTSSFSPSICSQLRYNSLTGEIKINPKGVFDSSTSEIVGVFGDADFSNYTDEKYKEIFNTNPLNVMPYIISNITCGQKNWSNITANEDGTYSFQISLDGSYLALAALCYSYEIKFSSGMADPPKWVSLSMEVKIDSDFNFVAIDYVESYKMNVSGIGMMQVTDVFHDTFNFVEVPEIEEVL